MNLNFDKTNKGIGPYSVQVQHQKVKGRKPSIQLLEFGTVPGN
jgi:hypothetical protein